ncbi:MAG: Gram-negative porin [Rhodobacteraceae bacterium HLUCCO07]|nr:MAG: Gram-negative porin [Rhodobacteraceae bacterium HLUCCO07]
MHRILLSTTALISIAGAASADITWSGKAELGYNTEEQVEDGKGVIATAEITPTFTTDLDFGLTAKAEATFILLDQAGGGGLDTDDLSDDFDAESYILSLSNDNFALEFGTTDFAPDSYWESAGDMEADGFSEADGETGVLFSGTYGQMSFGVSSALHTDDFAAGGTGEGEFDQLALAVSADMGNFDVSFAYQEEASLAFDNNDDFESDEIISASVGTTLQGVDLRLGYASNQTTNEDSTGIEVGYAIQDVSLGGYFVSESAGDDNWGLSAGYERGPLAAEIYYADEQGSSLAGIEGAYEVNERLVVRAGFIDDEDANDDGGSYIGAEYDLGNGASFLFSYADADAEDEDEFGGPEYRNGVTALVTLEF